MQFCNLREIENVGFSQTKSETHGIKDGALNVSRYIHSLECIILPMKYLFIYFTVDQGSFQLPTFKQLYRASCSVQHHGTVHQINQPFL